MFLFWFFMLCGMLATYIAMSPKINDGIVINLGVGMLSIGFFAGAAAIYEECDASMAILTIYAGGTIALVGIFSRLQSGRYKRVADWITVCAQRIDIERRTKS